MSEAVEDWLVNDLPPPPSLPASPACLPASGLRSTVWDLVSCVTVSQPFHHSTWGPRNRGVSASSTPLPPLLPLEQKVEKGFEEKECLTCSCSCPFPGWRHLHPSQRSCQSQPGSPPLQIASHLLTRSNWFYHPQSRVISDQTLPTRYGTPTYHISFQINLFFLRLRWILDLAAMVEAALQQQRSCVNIL